MPGDRIDKLSFEALKAKQRAIRDRFPDDLGLRVHRSLSWLNRAEMAGEDHDAAFIFYWISFNAAYAKDSGDASFAASLRRHHVTDLAEQVDPIDIGEGDAADGRPIHLGDPAVEFGEVGFRRGEPDGPLIQAATRQVHEAARLGVGTPAPPSFGVAGLGGNESDRHRASGNGEAARHRHGPAGSARDEGRV